MKRTSRTLYSICRNQISWPDGCTSCCHIALQADKSTSEACQNWKPSPSWELKRSQPRTCCISPFWRTWDNSTSATFLPSGSLSGANAALSDAWISLLSRAYTLRTQPVPPPKKKTPFFPPPCALLARAQSKTGGGFNPLSLLVDLRWQAVRPLVAVNTVHRPAVVKLNRRKLSLWDRLPCVDLLAPPPPPPEPGSKPPDGVCHF